MGNARGRRSPQGVLGGNDQPVALRGNEFAEHGFRLAALIAIGGVDEVAAGLQVTVKNAGGFIALGAMPPAGSKIAGTQRQFRDAQAGFAAEHFVMHGKAPSMSYRCFETCI
ncbi:hypothetical protein D3C73_786720 [compost metagenome]